MCSARCTGPERARATAWPRTTRCYASWPVAGYLNATPMRAFIEAVQKGTPAYPDFAEALRAHILTDAIYRSAADGGASVAV